MFNLIEKLCRGIPEELAGMMKNSGRDCLVSCFILAVICSSIYGMSVGIWRAPLQGFYVAVKFPLLIVLVTLGNALLNGLFAKVLGAKLTFRESFIAVLMSFTIASVILASFAPLMLWLIWNSPAVTDPNPKIAHHGILLFNVITIAFAGAVIFAKRKNHFIIFSRCGNARTHQPEARAKITIFSPYEKL